jgi:hypothetical protein
MRNSAQNLYAVAILVLVVSIYSWSSAHSQNSAHSNTSAKLTYEVIGAQSGYELNQRINQEAAKGWELVSMAYDRSQSSTTTPQPDGASFSQSKSAQTVPSKYFETFICVFKRIQ